MDLSLVALVLLAALLHALWNSFVKVGSDRLASVAAICATGGLLSLPCQGSIGDCATRGA